MIALRDLQALASAKLLAPFAATFAAYLVAQTGPFGGVQGGIAFSVVAMAMALLQGGAAARRAFPPAALKILAALGLMTVIGARIAAQTLIVPPLLEQVATAAIVGGALTVAFLALAAHTEDAA